MNWISVEDRLPEDGQEVLFKQDICVNDEKNYFVGKYHAYLESFRLSVHFDGGLTMASVNLHDCVTHWAEITPPEDVK